MLENLATQIIQNEGSIRLSIFFSLLFALLVWEQLLPRRPQQAHLKQSQLTNLSLVISYTIIIRLLFPIVAVGMAHYASEQQQGLFNLISLPLWLNILLGILLLDVIIYWQHRLFHIIPLFWRLHQVHHTDINYNLSTGVRFHPIEIILSLLIKMALVWLLGVNAIAVLLFEILLSSCALFNHSNIQLPAKLEPYLRKFIVTPDMHRIHHSIHRHETDSNYGFSVPWWDHLFGSYCANPQDGQIQMQVGQSPYLKPEQVNLSQSLQQPFKSKETVTDD